MNMSALDQYKIEGAFFYLKKCCFKLFAHLWMAFQSRWSPSSQTPNMTLMRNANRSLNVGTLLMSNPPANKPSLRGLTNAPTGSSH